MKELTSLEMESIAAAGLFDLPCALTSFTVQSALGLVSAGVKAGLAVAVTAAETVLDLYTNAISYDPQSIGSILVDHANSLSMSKTGIWSDFVYDAASDWGQVVYSLQK